MARLTENGLEWDKFGAIFSRLQTFAEERFEDLIEGGDELITDESSVLGRILAIVAEPNQSNEELIFEMYSNFDIDQAEGVYLDKLAKTFYGMERKAPTPAIAGLILRGTIGVTVPEGSYVSNTKTKDKFTTYTDVTFDNEGVNGVVLSIDTLNEGTTYTISYQSTANMYPPISVVAHDGDTAETIAEKLVQTINSISSVIEAFKDNDDNVHVRYKNFNTVGTFTASGGCSIIQSYTPTTAISATFTAVKQIAGDLNVIQTPILGWLEVYNPFDSLPSTPLETDADFRTRLKASKGYAQRGNREVLISALYGLAGVTFVNVQENIQDIPLEGRTAHGISVTVMGGDDDDIARVIDFYRAFAYTDGSVEITRYDVNGTPYVVRFNRPEFVPIEIKLGLSTNSTTFPADGVLKIKDALVSYFESLNVGEDVLWSQLFNPINTVKGQSVTNLTIGIKGQTLTTDNIEILHNQLATLSYEDIII